MQDNLDLATYFMDTRYGHNAPALIESQAIIASGYSETERVREALRLGAGPYIKKPDTMEKIGMAVRHRRSQS